MKREFETLNNMSFSLPKGWVVSSDKYNLENGQGFFNKENYISKEGKVVSFFEVFQNGEKFIESYKHLTSSFTEKKDGVILAKQFNIRLNDFSFPIFILKGVKDKVIYNVQAFIDCGDKMGCLMFYIDKVFDDDKQTISQNPLFMNIIEILRTVE